MKIKLFYKLLILLFLILFIISVILIIQKYYKKEIKNNNIQYNENINYIYDGLKLLHIAKKKNISTTIITKNNKVDCNSNILECKNDDECKNKCLKMNTHKIKCSQGLCTYIPRYSICENGGQISSYFNYGRTIIACICPENFIGLRCQIPNEMKSSESRTFEIIY